MCFPGSWPHLRFPLGEALSFYKASILLPGAASHVGSWSPSYVQSKVKVRHCMSFRALVNRLLTQSATHRNTSDKFHNVEGPLAILMMLAKLSAPRSLCPDMEHWFQQDASRISRFWRAALRWTGKAFLYTLSFDKVRLRRNLKWYAHQVCKAAGGRQPIKGRCVGFVDGTFRFCCRPGYV